MLLPPSRSTTRTHGVPHAGQQPFSEVPALMHGSTSAGGNVAKWAPLNGAVAMVQTERMLRLLTGSHVASMKERLFLTRLSLPFSWTIAFGGDILEPRLCVPPVTSSFTASASQ